MIHLVLTVLAKESIKSTAHVSSSRRHMLYTSYHQYLQQPGGTDVKMCLVSCHLEIKRAELHTRIGNFKTRPGRFF